MNYSDNYIKLVNNFWKADTERPFQPTDTRLYFYLVHTCNTLGWKQPFGHSDRHLAIKAGMSVNTVRAAKERLKGRGLIDYNTPEIGSKSIEGQTKYWFTVSIDDTVEKKVKSRTVSKNDTVIDTVLKATVSKNDTVIDTVSDTNNKLNETSTTKLNTHEVAGAPSGEIKVTSRRLKKEKNISSVPPKLYTMMVDIYDRWHKNENEGEAPQIDGAQGKAMKSIIAYLKKNVRSKNEYFKDHNPPYYLPDITEAQVEQRVLESWGMIFDNWHLLRNFYQSRTKLTAINSDIQDILKNIRNGINNKNIQPPHPGSAGNNSIVRGKGASTGDIQGLKRNGSSNHPK